MKMYQITLLFWSAAIVHSSSADVSFEKCELYENKMSLSKSLKIITTSTAVVCAFACSREYFCHGMTFSLDNNECLLYSNRDMIYINEVSINTDLYVFQSGSPCPAGWIFIEANQACYYISSQKMSWNNAMEYCWYTMGGYLSDIEDQIEQDAIVSLIKATIDADVWVGGSKESSGFSWTGNLDAAPKSVVYNNWAPGEPFHKVGGIRLWKYQNFTWDDNDFTSWFHFVCKMPRRIDC